MVAGSGPVGIVGGRSQRGLGLLRRREGGTIEGRTAERERALLLAEGSFIKSTGANWIGGAWMEVDL